MHELIEQKQTTPMQVGGSQCIVIPSNWLTELNINAETSITIRLCKGKKGKFIDIYKQ